MTIQEVLAVANEQLRSVSESPSLDAELLLSSVLNKPRSFFYTWPEKAISQQEYESFINLIKQRVHGKPIAYLTGYKEFWSLELNVTKDVLIPRAETELLVEQALAKFENNETIKVADLGTGSGAIALALAYERSNWEISATDLSNSALNVAKENAKKLKISNVKFFQGHWLAALPKVKFNMLISNPPYIANDDIYLQRQVIQFEPREALIAQQQGLSDLFYLIEQSKQYLQASGWLLLEHGFQQGTAIREFLKKQNYKDIRTYKDLNHHERVTEARFI